MKYNSYKIIHLNRDKNRIEADLSIIHEGNKSLIKKNLSDLKHLLNDINKNKSLYNMDYYWCYTFHTEKWNTVNNKSIDYRYIIFFIPSNKKTYICFNLLDFSKNETYQENDFMGGIYSNLINNTPTQFDKAYVDLIESKTIKYNGTLFFNFKISEFEKYCPSIMTASFSKRIITPPSFNDLLTNFLNEKIIDYTKKTKYIGNNIFINKELFDYITTNKLNVYKWYKVPNIRMTKLLNLYSKNYKKIIQRRNKTGYILYKIKNP